MIWKTWRKRMLNSDKIWTIWKKGKLNSEKIWKIQQKIVKKYEKYGRKVTAFSISFHNFLLYFPYLITIQPNFLPYFPCLFTIQLIFFHNFHVLSLFNLHFRGKLNSEKIWKIQQKIVKRYGKYGRKPS
jgi:outer membrane protein assembly factor BamA